MSIKKGASTASKRAEAGIGTLILFIAFILVAAIAASVLISTGGTLQSKALSTGAQTQQQVSNGVQVISIYGENASVTPQIGYLYGLVKLNAGSNPIQLNGSLVDYFSADHSQSYKFNQSGNCSFTWLSDTAVSREYFAVEGKEAYDAPGLLREGDVVLVCIRLPASLSESQKITWQFAPKNGVFTKVKTETPNVMTSAKTFLYP